MKDRCKSRLFVQIQGRSWTKNCLYSSRFSNIARS